MAFLPSAGLLIIDTKSDTPLRLRQDARLDDTICTVLTDSQDLYLFTGALGISHHRGGECRDRRQFALGPSQHWSQLTTRRCDNLPRFRLALRPYEYGVDIPVFHLDWLNNRMLIAIIAILHVVINHGMAVGGIPLVAYLEHRGRRSGDPAWDELGRRILSFFFVITTTVGASRESASGSLQRW